MLLMPLTISSASIIRPGNIPFNKEPFQPQNLQSVSKEQYFRAKSQKKQQVSQWLEQQQQNDHNRELLWDTDPSGWEFGEGFDPYLEYELMYAPSYNNYTKWSQAYRMLGAYIDCDHPAKDADENPNDDGANNSGEVVQGCSRWMMWAAYVFEDSSNNQEEERRLTNANESLTCGETGSPWRLLGVYRQEFYQFIQQISRHKWGITDARYITSLAALDYITEYDCQYVGVDNRGNKLYAGVQPLYGAYFQMSLYSDTYCVKLSNSKYTYDDFFAGSSMDLNCNSDDWTTCMTYNPNNDDGRHNRALRNDDYNVNYDYQSYDSLNFFVESQYQASQVWKAAQEYTLTTLNKIFQEFTQCTPCMDYPSYQDGFFNGNSGYSDGDLINQCWKFYSHNSYTCNGDCQTMARRQGTVYNASPNSTFYDKAAKKEKYYVKRATSVVDDEDFLCSTFLLLSTLLFVAALSSFYFITGGKVTDYFCNDLADDEPCVAGCGTNDYEAHSGGEDKKGKTSPWYKSIASRSMDDSLPPPPPPPPPPRKGKVTDNQALYITPSKTKSMDDDSPSKDALLPSSPTDLDDGYTLKNSQSKESYNPPRYMYSMEE
jgi:hypothetical protein